MGDSGINGVKPNSRRLARRQAILSAASELFQQKGFEGTSLSDILDQSKGSRSTLYNEFGNKEGLLRTMVEESCARVWEKLGWETSPKRFSEDGLIELGRQFVEAALAPDAVAVYRIVVAAAPRFPDISELFIALGPRTVKEHLSTWFLNEFGGDEQSRADADRLSQIFIGSVLGDLYLRQTLGLQTTIDPAAILAHVTVAVQVFLHGVTRLQK